MLRRPPSRLLRSLAIHTSVGYAIGIVLALVLAVVQVGPQPRPTAQAVLEDEYRPVKLIRFDGIGYTQLSLDNSSGPAFLPGVPVVASRRVEAVLSRMSAYEIGSQFLENRYRVMVLVEFQFGWPLRSMWCGALVSVSSSSPRTVESKSIRAVALRIAHEIPTNGKSLLRSTAERNAIVLPTGILLVGSIANGLLFGAITFAMCRVKPLVRSARGKCAGCGYTIAGERICPECGRERRERRGRATASSRTPASAEPSR